MYCSRIHIQRVLFEKHGQDQKPFAVPRVLGAIRSMVGEPGKFLWKVCKIKATAPQVMTASGSGKFYVLKKLAWKMGDPWHVIVQIFKKSEYLLSPQ